MVLTFSSQEVRDQIAHARDAVGHQVPLDGTAPVAAALHLTRREGRIFLVLERAARRQRPRVCSGLRAGRVSTDTQAQDELATMGDADFVESIAVDVFSKALAKPEVVVVVTRSYINVLGGQPERPPSSMMTNSFRAVQKPSVQKPKKRAGQPG